MIIAPEPRKPLRNVRVKIGDQWIEESTNGDWSDDEARSRALSMIERLLPRIYAK